jgi:hypothetical protein
MYWNGLATTSNGSKNVSDRQTEIDTRALMFISLRRSIDLRNAQINLVLRQHLIC